MYKVLIAEDEMMFRMMLKSSVNWSQYNMKVVCEVSNGADGWDMFQQAAPDIVITDLRMPTMDGMEFIRRIRESDMPKTKIVILSCLDDFEMVRKALKYGVSDYVLKLTMSAEELEAILVKISQELEQEGQVARTDVPIGMDADVLKENLLKDFLFRKRYSTDEFTRRLTELGMRLNPLKSMVGAIMEIDHYERIEEKLKDRKGQIIRMSILNLLEEVMSGFRLGEPIFDYDSRYLLLANCDEPHHILPLLMHIKKVMLTYFNVTVTFGISVVHRSINSLESLYNECTSALEQKFIQGLGTLIHYESHVPDNDQLISYFLVGNEQDWLLSRSYRAEMFRELSSLKGIGTHAKQQIIWLFLQKQYLSVLSLRLTGDAVSSITYQYSQLISKSETLQEVFEFYDTFLEKIDILRSKHQMSIEVSQLMGWIEDHYSENINLQLGAAKVGISYNYLSMLFKKQSGLSFVDYLMQVRIEKSKELLLKTNLKLYEIMEQVGFTDQSYFSRSFKKSVGVKPSEFRKTVVVDEWDEADGDET